MLLIYLFTYSFSLSFNHSDIEISAQLCNEHREWNSE